MKKLLWMLTGLTLCMCGQVQSSEIAYVNTKSADLSDATGQSVAKLHLATPVRVLRSDGSKSEIELTAKIHAYDVESKDQNVLKTKSDRAIFLWPETWDKAKSDYYYRASGQLAKMNPELGTTMNIVSDDADFITVRLQGNMSSNLLSSTDGASSQRGSISGVITKGGVPRAAVEVKIQNIVQRTNENGQYRFTNLIPGREYKLYVDFLEGDKPSSYVNLLNFPLLGPGEDLVYPTLDLDDLKSPSKEEIVLIISDGYVTGKDGASKNIPRFISAIGNVDRVLSAEMTMNPKKGPDGQSKEQLQEEARKIREEMMKSKE